jgi:hypothetical protein
LWYQKLREELDQRDLRRQLIECLKIADIEEKEKIMKYLKDNEGRQKLVQDLKSIESGSTKGIKQAPVP